MPMRSPLTCEQRTAATAVAARVYIEAGPGSGKTTVAAERFGVLRYGTSADLRRILALSFTRSACSELEVRIRRRWGSSALSWPHQALTLDALHCEILGFLLRRGTISWMGRHTELTVLDTWRGQTGARWMSSGTNYKRVATLYGTVVRSDGKKVTSPGYYISQKGPFETHLAAGRCTHAEVRQVIRAALRSPELRVGITKYLTDTVKGVIIDEVFDADLLDLEVIHLIASAGISTTIIGDPWQALYDFRGARPELVSELVKLDSFDCFSVESSFRFKTQEMIRIAAEARSGKPIFLNEAADAAECNIVLAHQWDTLWAGPDCVLPFSFGRLDNQTDAAVTLLLDRLIQSRFGQPAINATEAAVLLGLDQDRLRNDAALIDLVLMAVRQGTVEAATAAIDALRNILRALGSPARLPRLKQESEKLLHNRLLNLARRMQQSHVVAGISVHQAKGREWPTVGIRLTDPERARLAAGLQYDRPDDRLLYVALTRAAQTVVCC